MTIEDGMKCRTQHRNGMRTCVSCTSIASPPFRWVHACLDANKQQKLVGAPLLKTGCTGGAMPKRFMANPLNKVRSGVAPEPATG